MIPLTVQFIARDHARRKRHCYWNGPGKQIYQAMTKDIIYLPSVHAKAVSRDMLMNKETLAEFLLSRMRKGDKWRPISWRESPMLRDGFCYVQGNHTFVEHTPRTVGIKTSPAHSGVEEAIDKYGLNWEEVRGVALPVEDSEPEDET